MTTLDQLEALADAAKQPIENSMLDFQDAANPETIKQLIALCRMQHEALCTYSWKAEHRRTADDECLAKEALAAFDVFNNGRE